MEKQEYWGLCRGGCGETTHRSNGFCSAECELVFQTEYNTYLDSLDDDRGPQVYDGGSLPWEG